MCGHVCISVELFHMVQGVPYGLGGGRYTPILLCTFPVAFCKGEDRGRYASSVLSYTVLISWYWGVMILCVGMGETLPQEVTSVMCLSFVSPLRLHVCFCALMFLFLLLIALI